MKGMQRSVDGSSRLSEGLALMREDAAHQLVADATRATELTRRLSGELAAPTSAASAVSAKGGVLASSISLKLGSGLLLVGSLVAAAVLLWPSAPAVPTALRVAQPMATPPSSAATPTIVAPDPAPQPPAELPLENSAAAREAQTTPARRDKAVAERRATRPHKLRAAGPPAPERELVLLERARASVAHEPQTTLRLCREHAEQYPDGIFVQEREVLAIEALLGSQRRRAAERRAARFQARFPRSSHLHRVQRLLLPPQPSNNNADGRGHKDTGPMGREP